LLFIVAEACIVDPLADEKPSKLPDGARCESKEDCKSGGCNRNKLCAHSRCDCPGSTCDAAGERSKDCSDGWLCVYYEGIFEDVGVVFGFDRDLDGGACKPLCEGGCPEHYLCTDGRYCTADPYWADPIPSITWSGDSEGNASGRGQNRETALELGKSVTIQAQASSPIGAEIRDFTWTIVSSSGARTMLENTTIDLTLEMDLSYKRAELTVVDADGRGGDLAISFKGCFGPGTTCGYQGSGCCNECNDERTHCL
jgi:hypothetical protein